MLYVLPPPSAPNPPSPWNSILCEQGSSSAGNGGSVSFTSDNSATWGQRPPASGISKGRFSLKHRGGLNDSGTGVLLEDDDATRGGKSLSECYFAGKGAAVVLPPHERLRPSRRVSASGSDIQQHLQSMFYLLRPEETLKMAVKLESGHSSRTRYLVVVSCVGRQDAEESCLLGIDCNERTTVGLVLRVLADTAITLDGDGGFSVSVCGRQHIFKPVSVQAMWSALQTLHKVSSKAREQNYFLGGVTHDWVSYYEQRIESDRSCLNEWHAMDSLESRRPPSPDSVRTKPRQRDETERVIRATLKEIMMSVDLDEVTSKYIRSRLEEDLDMDLGEFKSFIDQEMLVILGQMDSPTEIFDHVYLGSEWNASNLEELQKNGVGHILNVTREIDNFFPGMFNYLNIRVYDDEKTDLLKHWDNTFKYISRAKKEGSKVLVHCKMGVSRSASVVIAYAMKAYNWDFAKAMKHVKEKRTCIKPNNSFLAQLETYQGILDAMKNKEKLQRSKSETNLKSPVAKNERIIPGSEPTPMIQALYKSNATVSGQDLRLIGGRPKSWSPDNKLATNLLPPVVLTSVSLENLNRDSKRMECFEVENRYVLMPCQNGLYSVSPNHIFHLPTRDTISVKHRINELESQQKRTNKKGLVLNLMSHKKWDPGEPESDCVNNCDSLVSSVNIFSDRECPSRQSSWSSYDSAVVLGDIRDVPSRQSSWGSGDARILPSRNSSWGSYDIKPDYPIKRTKQSDNVTIKLQKCNQWSRLSKSAPDNSTVLPICVPPSNSVNNICGDHDTSDARIAGIVKSLKQEFEAKTNNIRSLPSSPITQEDLSVKKLVGKYEEKKEEPIEAHNDKKSKKSLLVRNLKNEFKRPPVPPTVKPMLLATVVTNAANKKQQQHGKTHPLSRLTINKQRHPVYNTM